MRRRAALLFDFPSHLHIPYAEAWHWQRSLLNARTNACNATVRSSLPDAIFALEHTPVYTLGRAARVHDLKFGQDQSDNIRGDAGGVLPRAPCGADVIAVDRGGKVTWHGPGQLVVYPLIDLKRFREDLHWYVRGIEETIITALQTGAGLTAFRRAGSPGVWIGAAGFERKIAAVGMNTSKWATQHGFAINVTSDLSAFNAIVPCGIDDRGVTSIQNELGPLSGDTHMMLMTTFRGHVLEALAKVFDLEYQVIIGDAREQATIFAKKWESS